MKAIGYIRVSTQSQVDEGVSMDAQKAKIRAWCDINDYELVAVYEDAGISGTTLKGRDGLLDAIEATEKGFALVTYSMSRVSRSVRDMIDIGDGLSKKGADLVSITEKIDTTTASGKMVFNMLAVMNQFERDQCSERVTFAMRHMKAQGKRVGSIPHGYELADDNLLVPEADGQQMLKIVNQLKDNGYSLRKISAELAEKGIFNKHKKPFAAQSIKQMLAA